MSDSPVLSPVAAELVKHSIPSSAAIKLAALLAEQAIPDVETLNAIVAHREDFKRVFDCFHDVLRTHPPILMCCWEKFAGLGRATEKPPKRLKLDGQAISDPEVLDRVAAS